jgi:hypothetical protein
MEMKSKRKIKRGVDDIHENSPRPCDMQRIENALALARPWGLEAEVMHSALVMAAEANAHGQTMEQVLEAALGEWDL